MPKCGKWDNGNYDGDLKVALFISRNKDNEGVAEFVERRNVLLTNKTKEQLTDEFASFVNKGVPGEMSRFYMSVNARDNVKVAKSLLQDLLGKTLNDSLPSMAKLSTLAASIAARPECRAESKWLFDYDDNPDQIEVFIGMIMGCSGFKRDEIELYPTPHGYAIIVPRGFDTRELKLGVEWAVTIKRDDLLCVDWRKRE